MLAALACAAGSGCSGGSMAVGLMEDVMPGARARLAAEALAADTPDGRREAIVTMSQQRWWGLRPAALRAYALIARTRAEEPTVRCVALRALGRAGADAMPHADDILSALGETDSPHVRWDAAVALDGIQSGGDPSSLARIISALVTGSGDAPPPENADDLAAAWPDKVIPHLMAHLKWDPKRQAGEPSLDVRRACARALRNWRRTDVVVVLASAMENDEDFAVRKEAHDALVAVVGRDRGWAESDWEKDMTMLEPLPSGPRPWWDPLGVFVGSGDAGDDPGDG